MCLVPLKEKGGVRTAHAVSPNVILRYGHEVTRINQYYFTLDYVHVLQSCSSVHSTTYHVQPHDHFTCASVCDLLLSFLSLARALVRPSRNPPLWRRSDRNYRTYRTSLCLAVPLVGLLSTMTTPCGYGCEYGNPCLPSGLTTFDDVSRAGFSRITFCKLR